MAWMTNLFNFMDGSDGLAGGMALFGFGAYAVAAGMAGAPIWRWRVRRYPPPPPPSWHSTFAGHACFSATRLHPAQISRCRAWSAGWREALWPFWFPLVSVFRVHRRCERDARPAAAARGENLASPIASIIISGSSGMVGDTAKPRSPKCRHGRVRVDGARRGSGVAARTAFAHFGGRVGLSCRDILGRPQLSARPRWCVSEEAAQSAHDGSRRLGSESKSASCRTGRDSSRS